ncbi:MAG: HYR domain-containing protein, partial [Saprospiraceae bacterium]|nr:HYR domain-containing protein [Saprospiraceae bacterium]
ETSILVNDQTPPQLFLKDAVVDLDATGHVSVSAGLFDNGSFDNCGIAQWSVTPNAFQCGQTGLQSVTITATDIGGNASTGTATLLVQDNIVPQLFCPQNIQTGFCQPIVAYNLPQLVDNCPFVPTQLVQVSGLSSGSSFPVGVTTVAFRYADASGNIGQCSFEVNVSDPADFQAVTQHVACVDACNGSLSLLQLSGGPVQVHWSNGANGFNNYNLCPGTYTATITDAYQCTQTKVAQIEVNDTQAPQVLCPGNQTVGYCHGPVVYNTPLVNDNCTVNPALVQLTGGLPSGSNFPIGVTTQTYAYTDGSGNTGQCSFSVTVTPAPSVQTSLQSPACHSLCNGAASLAVSGGAGPYNIQWSNGQTGIQATNLCAGSYAYSVQDQAGCTLAGAINLTQPDQLGINLDQVQQDPGNLGAGSILVQTGGGTAPYSHVWTRNGQFFANTEDLNNLFSGQYALVVTDAKGCTSGLGPINISNSVGTEYPETEVGMEINPNPAANEVWVSWATFPGEISRLKMIDQGGRIVMDSKPISLDKSTILDISGLPQGIYLVQLSNDRGHTINHRFLIAR